MGSSFTAFTVMLKVWPVRVSVPSLRLNPKLSLVVSLPLCRYVITPALIAVWLNVSPTPNGGGAPKGLKPNSVPLAGTVVIV